MNVIFDGGLGTLIAVMICLFIFAGISVLAMALRDPYNVVKEDDEDQMKWITEHVKKRKKDEKRKH